MKSKPKNPAKENKEQSSKTEEYKAQVQRTVFYKWCKKRGFIINGYLEEDEK